MEIVWTTGKPFGNQIFAFDSSRNLCQGIHHSTTPGAAGSVAVHIGTGTPVARDEDRIKGTIPKPTFARRLSTMSSLFPVDIPQISVVGQQRQQTLGTAIRQIPYTFYILMLEGR